MHEYVGHVLVAPRLACLVNQKGWLFARLAKVLVAAPQHLVQRPTQTSHSPPRHGCIQRLYRNVRTQTFRMDLRQLQPLVKIVIFVVKEGRYVLRRHQKLFVYHARLGGFLRLCGEHWARGRCGAPLWWWRWTGKDFALESRSIRHRARLLRRSEIRKIDR